MATGRADGARLVASSHGDVAAGVAWVSAYHSRGTSTGSATAAAGPGLGGAPAVNVSAAAGGDACPTGRW